MAGISFRNELALSKDSTVAPGGKRGGEGEKNPNTILIEVHAIKQMKLELYKAEDTNYG